MSNAIATVDSALAVKAHTVLVTDLPALRAARASVLSVDIAAILDDLTKKKLEKLDWQGSIVDLMKLVGMDSSLAARKQLATELHYTGNMEDSASMNVWLHNQVLTKLAETGGKVPAEFLS